MTSQQLRDLSNVAHSIEGSVFALVSLLMLVEALRGVSQGRVRLIWPLLIVGAALFLPGFVLTASGQNMRDMMAFMWRDPQQRQHLFMAVTLLAAGSIELWRRRKQRAMWSSAWPAALAILAGLLISHTEYGTQEAVAWAKQRHVYQGITGAAAAACFAAGHMRNRAGRVAVIIGPVLLFSTAVLLLMYREPPGAYETVGLQDGRGN